MSTLPARWAYAIAALAGAASWLGVAHLTGRREAWDSELYFSWVLPGLWLVCAGLGYFAPARPWRWGFTAFYAQAAVMIAQTRIGPLLPLGLILFGIYGAVGAVPAWLGSRLRRWIERRTPLSS
ncbi:MAG: hypothetical protein ACREMO_09045 [Gemmatimonadales bacterium]